MNPLKIAAWSVGMAWAAVAIWGVLAVTHGAAAWPLLVASLAGAMSISGYWGMRLRR